MRDRRKASTKLLTVLQLAEQALQLAADTLEEASPTDRSFYGFENERSFCRSALIEVRDAIAKET